MSDTVTLLKSFDEWTPEEALAFLQDDTVPPLLDELRVLRTFAANENMPITRLDLVRALNAIEGLRASTSVLFSMAGENMASMKRSLVSGACIWCGWTYTAPELRDPAAVRDESRLMEPWSDEEIAAYRAKVDAEVRGHTATCTKHPMRTLELTLDDYLYRLLAVSSSLIPPVHDRDAEKARKVILPLYGDAIRRQREKGRTGDAERQEQVATQLGWVPESERIRQLEAFGYVLARAVFNACEDAEGFGGGNSDWSVPLERITRETLEAHLATLADSPNGSRNGVPQVSGVPANEKAPAEAGAEPTAVQGDSE